jgi:hypothetical protein
MSDAAEPKSITRLPEAGPHWNNARRGSAIGLWAAQVLLTVAAVAACAAEIESILFTGPALALVGVILASWSVVAYSLSGPLLSAFCATLIVVFRWGPNEAEHPILAILFVYAFLSIPTALFVFPEILQWSTWPPRSPFSWRYSLRTLLVITTVLCVAVPALRFLFINVRRNDAIIFSLFVLLTMSMVGFSLFMFVAGRRGH